MKNKAFTMGLMGFALVCGVFLGLILTSCATVKPMDVDITYQMPERLDSVPLYQYYVSRNIVLTFNPKYSDKKLNESKVSGGIAKTVRNSIQISKSTAGVVPKTVKEPYSKTKDGRIRLGVAFEADDNVRLWFVQETTNPNSKFRFEYDDSAGTVVEYGGAYYNVNYTFKGISVGTRVKYFFIKLSANFKGFFRRTNVSGAENEPPYLLIKMKQSDDIRGAQGRRVQ
jgi:hypothetical protein